MYIRTDRLILKPLSEVDQAAVIRILTDDTVKKTYLLPDFQTEEQTIKLFNVLRAYSTSEKHYVRGIYLDEKLIGFLNDVEFWDGRIELGYVIHPDYHNQGYATEALRGVIRDLFNRGLTEVIAGAFDDNLASIRVMEKAGMHRMDRTEEIEYRGKVHRCVYYSTRVKLQSVISHYDKMVDEDNDPFRDPPILQEYMNKWDGQEFIDLLGLSTEKSVLEIGVGTGRIAAKVAPHCRKLFGIDISPKTIARASANLAAYGNMELICADFLDFAIDERFDVVYSSLTLMHFADKQGFINKAASLLNDNGRFVLSIDKNQADYIEMGTYRVKIYPDDPATIIRGVEMAGMYVEQQSETEFAYLFKCRRMTN
ncbi:MAG: GNAT family N-acetyltransferase [Lachnospiraceae bacterium]|nr:GNAT family N-acetyltransferase [Lachnospiraceae bacterium]